MRSVHFLFDKIHQNQGAPGGRVIAPVQVPNRDGALPEALGGLECRKL